MARLGDVCTVISGTTPKTSIPEYWDGDINWITPAELNEDTVIIDESKRKITEAGVRSCGLSPFPAGTVILSSRAPIGKTAIAGTEMYCNQGFKNLICSDKVFNKYLFWFLRCNTEMLNSLGRGATFKEISKSIVENIEIPLPDLPTQRRIAATLDKVSEGIAVCRQMLADLDLLVKSQFVEMFGDPSRNEKGWLVDDLAAVTTIVTYGLTVRPEYIDEGFDLVSARELHKGFIAYNEAPKISKEDFDKLSDKGKPRVNDILFSKTGSIGHCALVENNKPFAITQNAARIGLRIDLVNPLWLLYYLRMDYIQDWCMRHAKGNAVKDFQLQDMKVIPLFKCPIELQNQFADFVKQADKSKFVVQQQLAELETLKKSLMQEYFG